MIGVRAKISFAFYVAIAIAAYMGSPTIAQIPQSDVYFAKQIWTGVGEPIADAAMVVVDGKIIAVGPRGNVENRQLPVAMNLVVGSSFQDWWQPKRIFRAPAMKNEH